MSAAVDARAVIRRRIFSRLSGDEWMERHFGIACHAGDIADAVLELFETIQVEQVWQVAGHGPVPAMGEAGRRIVCWTPVGRSELDR